MMWLALRFPLLPLEIFDRGSAAREPVVVAEALAASAVIVACNEPAGTRGIRTGMTVAAAWAFASGLRVVVQDTAAERAALERVAAWALQFTPAVSLAPPGEVLLEIDGSLRIFGGLNRLWNDLERRLGELGYTALIAGAPTPLAAQWFARAGLSLRIRHRDTLRRELERLPASVLELPEAAARLLRDTGILTLGDCLALPREGLARRSARGLLDHLDRAMGAVPDPRPCFQPPAHFRAELPLPAPVDSAEMLLFAARRLIAELCGLLAATGKGAQRLAFSLSHEDGRETRLTLELVAASRDPAHLVGVLRERLERLVLSSPATSIALESGPGVMLAATSLSFLPDARDNAEDLARLIERLRARLGENAVQGLDAIADHRPERAWRACEPGNGDGAWATLPPSARPLWLLRAPRPLAQVRDLPQFEGPLTLVTTAERIESGWWDGEDTRREYFVARNPAQSLLWIFRERGGWYLHGFFA